MISKVDMRVFRAEVVFGFLCEIDREYVLFDDSKGCEEYL